MRKSIMKKILSLLCAVLVVASCSKEESVQLASGEGAMRFALAAGSGITSEDDATIKIYKYDEALMDYQLVRRYTNTDDVPEKLALLAGDYKAVVQVGERMVTSFDVRYYYGEKSFSITEGQVTSVEVECDLLSTIVRVVYGEGIATQFAAGYATTVAIDDEYNQAEINSGDVHSLKFTESKEGYFLMPEGQTTLVWQFEGINESEAGSELPDGSILEGGKMVTGGVITNVKANARYTISLKYSPDAPGGLYIDAVVENEPDEPIDNNVPFSPDPTIMGKGFDMTQLQSSIAGTLTYDISALANITKIEMMADGVKFDVLNDTIEGLNLTKVSVEDNTAYTLDIAEAFFANVPGGKNELAFYIEDVDGGKATKGVTYNCEGVLPLDAANVDLWQATAVFKASVLNSSATDVKIAYRLAGASSWTELAAVAGADGQYTATATDFSAGKNYEFKLIYTDAAKGKVLSFETEAGAQIPNAGLENWHTGSNGLYYPYLESELAFWLTGNNSFATLTKPDTENVRPGSTGTTSAYLKSQEAGAMGITKFAAGNLFTGTFRISGTNGTVTFGRDFTFTAKPKSFSFWMKNNEGTIDVNSGKPGSGTDIYTIMVIITDGTTFAVDTNDESTFLKLDSLATRDGVIGYGYITGQDSNPEWGEYTINITYREDMKNVKPKKLVLSFTPSGYGDYFCGSTKSWMYVDDVRFNY